MPFIAYPSSLENKTWQKKKSALAGKTGVGDKLDELKKAHGAIDTTAFEETNGFKSKQEFDQWKSKVDPELVKAEKLQKLLVAFSQFATSKANDLKKQKTCPSKTRELVEKMSATAKKVALDVGVCMTDVSEQIKKAQKSAADDDDAPDSDLLGQLKAVKTKLRNFVVAMGKVPGLVVTKTGITGTHRQTAKELAGGGGKLIEGTVTFETAKYVFVLEDKPPAGSARGIKRAIALQTKTNMKVMVRGAASRSTTTPMSKNRQRPPSRRNPAQRCHRNLRRKRRRRRNRQPRHRRSRQAASAPTKRPSASCQSTMETWIPPAPTSCSRVRRSGVGCFVSQRTKSKTSSRRRLLKER